MQLQTIHGNHEWQVDDLTLLMLLPAILCYVPLLKREWISKKKRTQSVLSLLSDYLLHCKQRSFILLIIFLLP